MKTYEELRNEQKILKVFASMIREEVFPLVSQYEANEQQLDEYRKYFDAHLQALWYGGVPAWDMFKFNLEDVKEYPLEIAYLIAVKGSAMTGLKYILLRQCEYEKALAVYDKYPEIKKRIIEVCKLNYSKRMEVFYEAYCDDTRK